ncbi:MAG TPA: class I SAM-dependent methyltransferase [Dongiaceae bacterium]|nr:class I SAM-dependent methyltransferase [Dongiaceae bacterium]
MPTNPWLGIPAADYEAHMADPAVRQEPCLDAAFATAIAAHRPATVAVLGCATGNGLRHLAGRPRRGPAVGIDLNPEYLAIARARHAARLPELLLVRADAERVELASGRFDLVQAALLFEYVDPDPVLERVARWLRPGGVLSVVLQLASARHRAVTPTAWPSLGRLEPILRPVPPGEFAERARRHGLACAAPVVTRLASGKEFAAIDARREA